MSKRRPQADQAVLAALESCQSNKRMKRMLIFGLRSLSELCTPPRGQFAENALEALDHGILSTLNEITINIANDEELTELIVKICWGITKGLERYNDKTERKHFIQQNGKQVLSNILNTIPVEVEMVNMVFEIIDILFRIDIPLDVSFVLVAFQNGMQCGNLSPDSVLKIFIVLNTLINTNVKECEKLKESNADVIILSYIQNLRNSPDSTMEEIISQGLKIVGDIGKNTDSSIEVIMATKKIIDEYQNKKRIVLAGNEALEKMVSAAKLSNALQNITSTAEFNERQNAFNLVNAIANIPSFITVIVNSGAIGLLVQVIQCTNEQLASGDIDEATRNCLLSSINILGHISHSRDHAKLVYDAGGVTVIVETLKQASNPEPGAIFASCASALASVIKNEDYATDLYNTCDVFTIIITALYNYGTIECVRDGCIKFLESASKHKSLHLGLINLFTVEIVSYSLQFLTTNSVIQMCALTILEELVPNVYTAACIYEYGGFKGFCCLLTSNISDKDVVILALSILVSLVSVQDAKSYMSDGVMVDAVVAVMLEQQASTQITDIGVEILKEIATEQDVERYLQILETSLTYASKDPETALKTIAGVCAFSRIQRLSASFAKQGVTSCLVRHIALVAQDKIVFQVNGHSSNSLPPYRLKLLTAEILAIERTLSTAVGQVDEYISSVFQSILVAQMKPLIQQHVKDTEYVFMILNNIAESHPLQDKKEMNKVVVALLSGLIIFDNLYKIPEIILSILLCLQLSTSFDSTDVFVNNQAPKSVLKYMKEHMFNMRVQLIGLHLLYNLVSAAPTLREPLKSLGAVETVKSILRLSKMESESRSVAALLLALLVPEDELHEYVSRNISDFSAALKERDVKRALVSLRVLADFSACPSANRLMTREKLQKQLKNLDQLDPVGEDAVELSSLAMQLIGALSSQNAALNDLRDDEIYQYLLKCIETSSAAGDAEGCLKGLHALRTVLDKHTEPLSIPLKRKIVKVALQTPNEFPRHTEIMHGVATVLGTFCQEDDESLLANNPEFHSFVEQLNAQMAGSVDPVVVQSSVDSLASLLKDSNEMIKTTVREIGVVPTLLELLDKHTNDAAIVKSAANCLDYLGSSTPLDLRNIQTSASTVGDSPLSDVCYTFRKCLDSNLNDDQATSALLRGFCRFLSPTDGPVLRGAGILNTVSKTRAQFPDSSSVNEACAEIVQLISSDDLVMEYIQQLITADAENDKKSLEDAINKLNVLLLTDLQDPENCLKDEEQLWEILTRRLGEARSEGRPKYTRSIVTLGQRLVEQGKSDPNGYRGSWYYTQYMFPTQVEMLMSDEILSDTANVTPIMLSTMAEAISNPATRQYCMQSLPISTICDLLDDNVENTAMAVSTTKLLHTIGSDDEGIQYLKNGYKDIVPLLCKTMRAHRGRVSIAVPVSSLLAALSSPNVGAASKSFTNGDAFAAVDQGTSFNPDDSIVLDSAFMDFLGEAIENPEIKPSLIKDDALRKALSRFETFRASKDYNVRELSNPSDAENSLNLKNSFVKMLRGYAEAGEGALVGKRGGTQILLDMIQEPDLDPTVKCLALETLVALSESNPQLAQNDLMTTVASEIIPWTNISATEIEDLPPYSPEEKKSTGKLTILEPMDSVSPPMRTSRCLINMFDVAAKANAPVGKHRIDMKTFLNLPQTQELLDEMYQVAEKENDVKAMNQIQTLAKNPDELYEQPALEEPEPVPSKLNTMADEEQPDGLTLKKVYDFLVNRLENNLSIDINDTSEPLLSEYAIFVLEKMTEYNDFQLEPKTFAGSESVWGSKSWELWLRQTPQIVNRLIKENVHILLLDYIIKQRPVVEKSQENHVRIGTAPSSTLVALGEIRDPGALTLASVDNIVSICTRNLTVLLQRKDEYTDENFAPRLLLVQKTAINRTMYEDPYIIEVFNRIWDLYDEGTLTFLTLIPLLQAFRAILCDNHMEYLEESHTVERLINELAKDYNTTLLIDGLFLLGVIGIDKTMKTVIGPHGVKVCLDILKNHMEDRPGEGVITNVQLALANIIVDQKQNTFEFLNENGLQANVRVLQERGEHFDETNAASALLTNACFRRDDIKEEYGRDDIGAPHALSYAISCYNGSTDPIALRCLTNLFKAISNMSLYTPNVDRFLQSGLEIAYYNLLEQSEALEDNVLNTCLFTLSNLTWENKEENMIKFGIIIPPLIKTVKQTQRKSPTLFLNTFATFIFLCRLEENCQSFSENGGIDIMFHIIKTYGREDLAVVQEGLSCFSVLVRRPLVLSYLNIQECFNLLKSVIEGDYFTENSNVNVSAQTSCMAFRSIRRILTNVNSEYVGLLNQCGFTDTLVWYFSCINSNPDLIPGLFHEVMRVLIALMAIGRGDTPDTELTVDQFIIDTIAPLQSTKTKAWFGRSNNTNETPVIPILEKPEGPRGYEVAGLDPHKCNEVTAVIFNLAVLETMKNNCHIAYLVLAWLSYLASEDIQEVRTFLFSSLDKVKALFREYSTEFGSNTRIIIYATYFFACLAYHDPQGFHENFSKDAPLLKLLKTFSGSIPKTKENENLLKYKQHYDEFLAMWTASVRSVEALTQLDKFATYNVNLNLSNWAVDQYPNGVHDLPIKEELRKGGTLTIIEDERTKKMFQWKANPTLSLFRWCVSDGSKTSNAANNSADFNVGIYISKISSISKGLVGEVLYRASKRMLGISNDTTLFLESYATEEFPNGVHLSLKFKNKKNRDEFFSWMEDWREASLS